MGNVVYPYKVWLEMMNHPRRIQKAYLPKFPLSMLRFLPNE
uniref:Uncharacterized protein n=1 Tax=Arundo donax TaxID=35708 RepID=A0A0A9DJZ3_ARUDO